MNSFRAALLLSAGVAIGAIAMAWLAPTKHSNAEAPADQSREILYWIAPMDPNYRSENPGKSPMGMDLVPVYADGASASDSTEPALRIDPAVLNNIGVKTAPVERGTLYRKIDTVGFVRPDADRIAHVHVRSEGWIEQLEADTEGDAVSQGALLFEIYSPALVSAQDEYLQALRSGSDLMIAAAESRLDALGMLPQQVTALKQSRSVQRHFAVRSPQNGYLMELNVRDGMFVEPGTTIMSLADLSEIWVDVDVFEQQIGWVSEGQRARMRLPFAPERIWTGVVNYVYPTIRPETRTARLRLTFDNPDLALKPNMYAKVSIDVAPRRDVLFVPSQAVIYTGQQARVILALGDGRFRPAEVETGLESDGRTEVARGLAEGEHVVVSSQFLIDSEASLDASLLRLLDADAGSRELHPADHQHDPSGAGATP